MNICGQAIFLLLRVGRSGSRRSTTTPTESIWGDFTTSVCEEEPHDASSPPPVTVARIRRERDHALEMSGWWCGAQLRTRGIGWWCHEWCNAEAIIDKTQMSDIERGHGLVTPTLRYKKSSAVKVE